MMLSGRVKEEEERSGERLLLFQKNFWSSIRGGDPTEVLLNINRNRSSIPIGLRGLVGKGGKGSDYTERWLYGGCGQLLGYSDGLLQFEVVSTLDNTFSQILPKEPAPIQWPS